MDKKALAYFLPVCAAVLGLSLALMVPRTHAPAQSAPVAQSITAPVSSSTGGQHTLLLKESGGAIALYVDGVAVQRYSIDVSLLPQADRRLLANGVYAEDAAQVNRLLEDWGA